MTTRPMIALTAAWLAGCTDPTRAGSDRGPDAPDPPATTDATDAPPTDTDVPPPAWPRVVINEVAPGNRSLLHDEAGDADDWLELYNPTDEVVPLADWWLTDGHVGFRLPADLALDPGARALVWCDAEPDEGPLHAVFPLDREGGEAQLLAPDAAIVDEARWDEVVDDVVWGRFPDGAAFTATSIVATPSAANPDDPGLSQDPSDLWFPLDRLVDVAIRLPQTSLDDLDRDPYTYVPGTLTWEGQTFPVGVHIKGQAGSFRDLSRKSAFKISFDHSVPGARVRGLEALTLNNLVQDPSCVHETLTYQLLDRMGAPTCRTAWARVTLNGEYRGLYLNLETIDDRMLPRFFDDPDGNLYEGEYGQDLRASDIPNLDLDEQGAADTTDRSELYALAALLDRPPDEALVPELEAMVDVDRTLATLASEVAVEHWDGYFHYPNNWRIYHDPTAGRLTVITSGTDQTWAGAGRDAFRPNGRLAQWMLAVPSLRARYELALRDAADHLRAMPVRQQVALADQLIRRPLADDPYREHDLPTHDAAVAATLDWWAGRPAAIDALLDR